MDVKNLVGVYCREIFARIEKQIMSTVNAARSIERLVAELHQLSEAEQRELAAAVLQDRKLEAFVEELEDHLSCERAAAEGSAEPFLG